jgi:hypothetical protein
MAMSDPSVDREVAANERRAANTDEAKRDPGLVETIERAFPFVREQVNTPDTQEEVEDIRRENDAEQRG